MHIPLISIVITVLVLWVFHTSTRERLPYQYDSSLYIPRIPIYYQSTCGSCWANATVTALQFRAYKQSLTNGIFEVTDVIKNTLGNFGCAGGSIRLAYEYCSKTGLFCNGRRYLLSRVKSLAGVGIQRLKTEILTNGPVTAHVLEYPSMKLLKRGETWRRQETEIAVGSHAVVIYGWDDSRGGWLIQNSWGKGWCEDGRGVFSYGAGYIESLFVFAGEF